VNNKYEDRDFNYHEQLNIFYAYDVDGVDAFSSWSSGISSGDIASGTMETYFTPDTYF